ncbi:hypothetical protein F4861DRAFT_327525 [Xylaria intraflava]|nr:hypothetical protein F4861DRAFT_327525 [Xylaria intraflava]
MAHNTNRHANADQQDHAGHGWPGRRQPGHIAFLKKREHLLEEDKVVLRQRNIPDGATAHPVIILDVSPDRQNYLVTTVSSYAAADHNRLLPPWQQSSHSNMDPNGFRAFNGTIRPNSNFKHLWLASGTWKKGSTNWVHVSNCYIVPATTLISFDKSSDPMRMTTESLDDLLGHMATMPRYVREKATLMTMAPPQKDLTKNWRRNDRNRNRRRRNAHSGPWLVNNWRIRPKKTAQRPRWDTVSSWRTQERVGFEYHTQLSS